MIRLRRMDEKGFKEFKAFTIEQVAQEMCLALDLEAKEARKAATAQTNKRLSQGLDTPGCFIRYIEQQTDSGTTCIGYLEYFVSPGETFAWLTRIGVLEPYRDKGHGMQALSLLERELAEMGLRSMNAHVSARNKRACALYQKQGFMFSGHVMEKSWSGSLDHDVDLVRLRKMDKEGFEDYKAYFIEDYAPDLSQSYGIDIEQARQLAAAQIDEIFPQGLDTPGCFVYCIDRQTNSRMTCIGYLQYSIPPGESFAWLDNIDIFEPYQNQGYGTQVLALAEQELEEMGIKRLSLHVAEDNERALAFYQKRGFCFKAHQMTKGLDLAK